MTTDDQSPLEDIDYGPFRTEVIERTLGIEIAPGNIVLTRAAQRHVRCNHGNDFARCLPHVRRVVTDPAYIGDDFRNVGKIELIGRLPGGDGLLVAVVLKRDDQGRYHVATFYPVTRRKIDERRHKGFLKNAAAK